MKGTLYTADFIKTSNGDFKLLELNTDTDIVAGALSTSIDFGKFTDILISESIDDVHIVHKSLHTNLVDYISSSLHSSTYTGSFNTTVESDATIYPTDVSDSPSTFVLRLAYNESAIFDSVYCKGVTNLYKLFTDNSASDSVINHYISASDEEYVFNNLSHTFNGNSVPDVNWKADLESHDSRTKKFIKIGNSSSSDSDRYNDLITAQAQDGDVITNYIDTSDGTDYMKSIRFCNIIYDTDLKNLVLGAYETDALLAKPTGSLLIDDSSIVNEVHQQHYFEFATNYYKFDYKTQGGIFGDVQLQEIDGTFVSASNLEVGTRYKSLHISGSSNTDNIDAILAWSSSGASLPVDSYYTSSVLVSTQSHEIIYNAITEIVISGSEAEFMLGPNTMVLVHDQGGNVLRYKRVHQLDSATDLFIGDSSSLHPIQEININILGDTYSTYELDVEDADTYIMNDFGVKIVGHNIRYGDGFTCFLADTPISMADGSTKSIQYIEVGDMVESYDLSTNQFVQKRVSAIDSSHTVGDHRAGCEALGDTCGVYHFIGNDSVKFTPEHPFLLSDGRWASLNPLTNQEPWLSQQSEVVNLTRGDTVLRKDGNYTINNIVFEEMDENTKVYNFTVEDTHTYIANGFVVHNK